MPKPRRDRRARSPAPVPANETLNELLRLAARRMVRQLRANQQTTSEHRSKPIHPKKEMNPHVTHRVHPDPGP